MHDVASSYVVELYLRRKYTVYPVGVDLRQHKVIIEDELPDYVVEKNSEIFCFDAKSKSSVNYFGWVNSRAAKSYRKLAKACGVLVYLFFVQVIGRNVRGETGYCSVEDDPIEKRRAWNGNIVWIFNWKRGLARI